MAGAGLGAVGAAVAGGAVAGVSIAIFGSAITQAAFGIIHGRPEQVVAQVRTESAGAVKVRRRHLAETRLTPGANGPLALDFRYKGGAAVLEGREALRIAGALMPHVNRYGGKQELVKSAVGLLDEAGGADGYLERLGAHAEKMTTVPLKRSGKRKPKQSGWTGAYSSGLFGLAPHDRLALEMALHEEAELRALQGELAELERAWREAEEVADIADNLLTPSPVRGAHERLRRMVPGS